MKKKKTTIFYENSLILFEREKKYEILIFISIFFDFLFN